jgi:UPF0271 protein
MQLNCDLGESDGNWQDGPESQVMPYIDLANIACGYHAGDPETLQRTLALAGEHNVAVGAHPSYADRVGFGRRSMPLQNTEIIAMLHYQIGALEGMALCQGLMLSYIKPHGALYHDMMTSPRVREAVFQAVASYHRALPLIMQATARANEHRNEAQSVGINLWFEAFADRRYADDGSLLPRDKSGAVLDQQATLDQATQLCREGTVTTASGAALTISADTLCLHGDNPEAVNAIAALHALIHSR